MSETNWILEATDAEAWARQLAAQSAPSGQCVVWTGKLDRYGYGVFRVGAGRVTGSHRAAWLTERGPLKAGQVIDHRCRNRACVLVDHMEPVTNRINTQRGNAGRHPHPLRTHCVNGHEYTEATTRKRIRRADGYTYRECRTCVAIAKRRLRADRAA